MAWQETEHRDFRGGENLADNERVLKPDQVVVLENGFVTGHGQVEKRKGMTLVDDAAQHPARIDAMSVLHRSANEKYMFVISDKQIRLQDGTVLYDGINEGPYGVSVFGNKWLLVDGDEFYESDGTEEGTGPVEVPDLPGATLDPIRRCRVLLTRGHRLFAAGDPEFPHVVYYSQPNEYNYFKDAVEGEEEEEEPEPADMRIPIGQHDAQSILVMLEMFGGILIGKPSGWWLMRGDPDADLRVERIITGQGPIHPCCVVAGSEVWYVSNDGVRSLQEKESNVFTSMYVGHPHNKVIKEADLSNAVMTYYDDRILFFYRRDKNKPGNDFCSVADLRFANMLENRIATWSRITGWSVSATTLDRDKLYAGLEDGRIVQLFEGDKDIDKTIRFTLKTPEYPLDETFRHKLFDGINLEIAQTGLVPSRPKIEVAVGLDYRWFEWEEAFLSRYFNNKELFDTGTYEGTKVQDNKLVHATPPKRVVYEDKTKEEWSQGNLTNVIATETGLTLPSEASEPDLVGSTRASNFTYFRVMPGFGDIKFGVASRSGSTNYFTFVAGDAPDFPRFSVDGLTSVPPVLHIGGPAGIVILTRGSSGSAQSHYSLDGQTFTSVSMTSHNPAGLTYGNGLYVAVGASSSIWTTPNLATTGWTRINPFPASATYVDVVYGGPLGFVALRSIVNNPIFYSSDGTNWTQISGTSLSPTGVRIYYGGPLGYVVLASGDNETIHHSTSGLSWSTESIGFDMTKNGIVYGPGGYVIVGDNGAIAHSIDGSTWTQVNSGVTSNLRDVTYVDEMGLYVAVGSSGVVLVSENGKDWFHFAVDSLGYGIARGPDKFVILGTRVSLTSEDGILWKQHNNSSLSNVDTRRVRYINGKYFAVRNAGYLSVSEDGEEWEETRVVTTNGPLYDIAYGNGKYIIGGTPSSSGLDLPYLFISEDLEEWIPLHDDDKPWTISRPVRGVAWGPPGFVVVGNSGKIAFSEDGEEWEEQTSGVGADLVDVEYIPGVGYIAVGTSLALKSEDGKDWSQITLPVSTTWYSIQFSDGQIVIGGRNYALTSTDGETWSVLHENPGTYVDNHHVADGVYAVGRYVLATSMRSGSSLDVPNSIISCAVETTEPTGTREIEVDLSDVGEFGDSLVTWEADEPEGTSIELEVKLNDDWVPLVKDEPLPGEPEDLSQVPIRQTLNSTGPLPLLRRFYLQADTKLPQESEWISPPLLFYRVGVMADSKVGWEYNLKGKVEVYVRYSYDDGETWDEWIPIVENGGPFPGLEIGQDLTNTIGQLRVKIITESIMEDPEVNLVYGLLGYIGSTQRHFTLRPRMRGLYIQHTISDDTEAPVTVLAVGERWRPLRRMRPSETSGSIKSN